MGAILPPMVQNGVQKPDKWGDGVKPNALARRMRRQNVHTGGNHGKLRRNMMQNGGFQPHMDGVFMERQAQRILFGEKKVRQRVLSNTGPGGIGVAPGRIAETFGGGGKKIALNFHGVVVAGADKALNLQLFGIGKYPAKITGNTGNVRNQRVHFRYAAGDQTAQGQICALLSWPWSMKICSTAM